MSDATPSSATTVAPEGRVRVPVGAIVLIVAGAVICLLALAPLAGGGALTWAYATQRDEDGYFTTPQERLETTTYAISSERIDLGSSDAAGDVPVDVADLATVRLQATATNDRPVFIGIASQSDVARYLDDVSHAELRDLRVAPFAASYRYTQGTAEPTPPSESAIWEAQVSGPGSQTLQWEPRSGSWSVVVMNADASPGVSVNASAGARAPWVLWVGIGLIAGGSLGIVVGAVLLVVGVVALSRRTEIDLTGPPTRPGEPIRLEARLDEPLNRWLWLVKWLLLLPHLIVLSVLWLAFSVVTFVAFFAILFTGRYPRRLFAFNLGVLRWTWRVVYYGYSALGTDRYPPFSLGAEPDYPATYDVAYPEHLSRGLVLIKWWLLAIPQYLVVGLFSGGALAGSAWRWGAAAAPFGGLIGLLVLFAALGLLFTGTYPRGIHDLVMGLNRWVYRVIPYIALMRDEYPPFRLDQGPSEPAPPPGPQSDAPTSQSRPVVGAGAASG